MQVAQELLLEPEFLWRIFTGDVGGHVEADVLSPGQGPDLQRRCQLPGPMAPT